MAIIVRDSNGGTHVLEPTGVGLGIGTTQVARTLEVAEIIMTRFVPDGPGPAAALSAHEDGLASLWTNKSYTPDKPTRGFERTINMKNGNVGIGGSKDSNALDPKERLVVVGNIMVTGKVKTAGADCAEEFNLESGQTPTPGTVVVFNEEGDLTECLEGYDRKVAGILSGAGSCSPGLLLGEPSDPETASARAPLALVGRAYCKADATYAPIKVGDLLTTSPTAGHAMKANDSTRAFGAVLGKAIQPLESGQGLILVLVTRQ